MLWYREPYEITEVRNPLTGIIFNVYFYFNTINGRILKINQLIFFKDTENVKNVVLAVAEKILELEDFKKEIAKKIDALEKKLDRK